MDYQLNSGKFPSVNKLCDVAWYHYQPKGVSVRAVLVICHGMSEHILRYDEFAAYLCEKGIAVYGCDHLGHGNSVDPDAPEYGYFGKNEKTLDVLVDNQIKLVEIIRKKYPHLPLVIFGHSMGSFTVRKLIVKYPDAVDGAIICGTGGANKGLGAVIGLLTAWSKLVGIKKRSKKLEDMMFGGYISHFADENDEYAWLTKDTDMRKVYADDPKGGFIFTLGATLCLLRTNKEVNSPEWYGKVPQGLPILLVSGKDDPVGSFGQGVQEVYDNLENAEICMLEMKLYENARHNILHETDRQTVFDDLAAFILKVSDGVYAARMYNRFEGNE